MLPTQQPLNFERELNLIHEVIIKNTSGIIVIPAKAGPDAIAAGSALYLALTKLGKTIGFVASQKPESDLIGVDKIQNRITTGGDNLVVSFPYREGAIDKVDYNIQDNKFNLVISPREGFPKLDPKEVDFTYTGGKVEFIITVDTPNLNSIGDVYLKNQREFEGKNIINIDRHLINNNYGTINMVVKSASSTSELAFKVIKALKVEIDKDIATNIYSGITAATNNYSSYSVNADTFETAAELLRAGAVKKVMRPMGGMPRPGMSGGQIPGGMGNFFPNPFSQKTPQMNQTQRTSFNEEDDDMDIPMPIRPAPMQQPQPQAQSQQSQVPQPILSNTQSQKPIEDVEMEASLKESDERGNENILKPRIFSESGGLV
jgi:nanoRNase/pAp phosphatase (c-di-AMP/oligoRNAs hydrolase)